MVYLGGKFLKQMKERTSLPYFLVVPTFILVMLLIAYPIFEVIRLSFTNLFLLRPGTGKFVGLRTFVSVFKDPVFPLVLKNTFIWIALGAVLSMGIGMAIGYYLSFDFKINRILRAVILIPWILPSVVSASVWQWMLNAQFGVINDILKKIGLIKEGIPWLGDPKLAIYALTFVLVWKNVPLIALLLSAAIQGVPISLLEAATIDGASGWQKFWRIVLPIISYTFLILTIVVLIWIIQQFVIIWVTTQGGPVNATHILPTYIYQMAFNNYRFGQAAALSVINILILISISFVYLWLFRRTSKKEVY